MRNQGKRSLLTLTRRQTLSVLGSAGIASFVRNPIDMLINGVVDGVVNKAHAEARGVEARRYFYFHLGGAPNRWVFDMPLAPYAGTPAIVKHPHITTRFTGTGPQALAPEYRTAPVTRNGVTLQMPSLWQCKLPRPDGTFVPMGDLLTNLLMIRGVNMQADGHDLNSLKQIRPNPAAASISGSVADRSSTPAPAVGMLGLSYDAKGFRSMKGMAQTLVSTNSAKDPLTQALSPFDASADQTGNYLSRRQAIDSAVQRALTSLGKYAKAGAPGAEGLEISRARAEKLVRAGIGDAANDYKTLTTKYEKLIQAVMGFTAPIPGVTDRPVPLNAALTGGVRLTTRFAETMATGNANLLTMIQPTTTLPLLAESFAIAEYLLIRGYSSAVTAGFNSINGVFMENITNTLDGTAVAAGRFSLTNDEHYMGTLVTLITDSVKYQALAACLYELIEQFKNAKIWEESLIHIGAEFGRYPRPDQGGSDHGWSANTVSLLSGSIRAPAVLGNLLLDGMKNESQPGTPGTWGTAAPVKVDGHERALGVGHTSSTIATILRVVPPLPNNSSLVVENADGSITPTLDPATQKAGKV